MSYIYMWKVVNYKGWWREYVINNNIINLQMKSSDENVCFIWTIY